MYARCIRIEETSSGGIKVFFVGNGTWQGELTLYFEKPVTQLEVPTLHHRNGKWTYYSHLLNLFVGCVYSPTQLGGMIIQASNQGDMT